MCSAKKLSRNLNFRIEGSALQGRYDDEMMIEMA